MSYTRSEHILNPSKSCIDLKTLGYDNQQSISVRNTLLGIQSIQGLFFKKDVVRH